MKNKILLIALITLNSFFTSAQAGENAKIICKDTQSVGSYKLEFQRAIMSPLIWGTIKIGDETKGLVACALEIENREEHIYICENGVDDRYNANPENFHMELVRHLEDNSSTATLLQNGLVLKEFEYCYVY